MLDTNTRESNTELLIIAAKRGRAHEVQRLIPISDPLLNESRALIAAASNGHVECVKLLIPVSNPKDRNSRALRLAVIAQDVECLDVLYPVSDPHQVLWGLKDNPSPDPESYLFFEAFMAQREHNTLERVVVGNHGSQKPKKL